VHARVSTTPGCPSACVGALGILPSATQTASAPESVFYRGSWLACTFPYRRFAASSRDACARLGADVVRYSFIIVELAPPTPCRLPGAPV